MSKLRRRIGKIKAWLDLNFPTKRDVMLRVAEMPKEYRDCLGTYSVRDGRRKALIRVSADCPISQQIDTLCHEWSHARIDPDMESGCLWHGGHTNEFYLEYGRIERALMKAMEGELKA